MDPHRGNYPDDTEARRFRAEHQYPEPGGPAWFDSPVDEGGYRPDRHAVGRPPYTPGMTGQTPPVPPEHRAQLPPDSPPWDPRQPWDPNAVAAAQTAGTREAHRAPARGGGPSADTRSAGRSTRAALLVIVIVAASVPVVRLLLASAFGPTLSASGVVSGVLLLLGLPLGAVGFHGLSGAAARRPVARAADAWLRPPMAYLVVALVLIIAAGLAA